MGKNRMPKDIQCPLKGHRMKPVLPGLSNYKYVQSREIKVLEPRSKPKSPEQTIPTPIIEVIKSEKVDPKNDQFPISTLKIPETMEGVMNEMLSQDRPGESDDEDC